MWRCAGSSLIGLVGISRRTRPCVLSKLGTQLNRIGWQMAKPNYAFEKRQKDLARKKKKEEKRQRKIEAKGERPPEDPSQPPVDETTDA